MDIGPLTLADAGGDRIRTTGWPAKAEGRHVVGTCYQSGRDCDEAAPQTRITMRRLFVFLASLGFAAAMFAAEVRTQHVDLKVQGMSCTECSKKVSTALLKLDGVKSADVSHTGKSAAIDFDGAKISRKDLEAAIEKAGYKVEKETPKKG